MHRPKPSMSLNPAAASFPFPKTLTPAKQSTNTSPTSTQSSWTGAKTASTSSNEDTKPSTDSCKGSIVSSTHPRTSSVSSATSTSSSEKKVKLFGEDWLSSSYDFKPDAAFLGGPDQQPIKQEDPDDELVVINDQANHLPPPPPIRRARSSSLPILPSEHSTPKFSRPHLPGPFVPRYTIDAASRKLLNSHLDGPGPGHRAPHHGRSTNAPWYDETHSFREPPSIDSITDLMSNVSINHQTKPTSVDTLADQFAGVVISPRHDQRHFNPVVGPEHHLMHHVSTPNFVRGHRRSDARVRFETVDYDEEDETSMMDHVRTTRGLLDRKPSVPGLMTASSGKNIYIHSVRPSLTEDELKGYGSHFGKVIQARCKAVGDMNTHGHAVPNRICGFVLFHERSDADAFLTYLKGESVVCDYGRDDFQLEHKVLEDLESSNLYFNGLPSSTTEMDLVRLLAPYGTIASCKLLTDRGERRGPIMVRMNTRAQAEAVIGAFNNAPTDSGKVLQVRIADSEKQKRLKASASMIYGPAQGDSEHRQRQSMPPPARERIYSPDELYRRDKALAELAKLDSIAEQRSRHGPRSLPAFQPSRPHHHRGITFPNSSASHPVMFPDTKHRHLSSNFSSYETVTTPTSNVWTRNDNRVSYSPPTPPMSWSSRGLNSETWPLWPPPTPSSATFSPSPAIWADQSWHSSAAQHTQEAALLRDARDIWTRPEIPRNQHSMHAKSSPELQRAVKRIPSSLWSELDEPQVKQEH